TGGARAARGLRLYRARVSAERPVILVVDDSSDLLALTTKMLADDYQVLTAEDAGTALELAAGTPRPDLILLDVEMPGATGHDIGKLGVPSEILRKRERLSAPDWEQVKRHPKLGADIIGEHDDPLLQLARQLALTHHERWDGSGYPERLRGNAIPWPGRVMAIVDAFEAMTTTQFYRDAMPIEKAAAEIVSNSDKRFNPALVEAFKNALSVMTKV